MTVTLNSPAAVDLPLGGVWDIRADVRDVDDELVTTDVPVVTVTLPGGSTATPTVEAVGTGGYRATLVLAAAGRYTARVVTALHGAADLAAYVVAARAGTGLPTATEFRDYATEDFGNWDDDKINATIATEAANQRRVCRVGAVIDVDLWDAILRRTLVSLQRRSRPVLITVDGDGSSSFLPNQDPEVRRLEAPHRKLVMG